MIARGLRLDVLFQEFFQLSPFYRVEDAPDEAKDCPDGYEDVKHSPPHKGAEICSFVNIVTNYGVRFNIPGQIGGFVK